MGKAPAVVFIARHGARLDAEDNQWASTSATPYDTPLSYGGWTQTRALGARIASLLHARDLANAEDNRGRRSSETDGYASDTSTASLPKRKKQRVVIHSSPFLRCLQSSVAVAAGMAQYTGNLNRFEANQDARPPQTVRFAPRLSAAQSRAQTLDPTAFDDKYGKLPATNPTPDASRPKTPGSIDTASVPEITKPILRIDAFLGEWLSPDYFEFITAPPPSNMMVAGAKAELLKSAEPIHGALLDASENHAPLSWASWTQFTPSMTESPTASSSAVSMNDLAQALPGLPGSLNRPATTTRSSSLFGYTPPTPLYALSQSEPIPSGYVAHARDVCVNIDFQWDSMREPQKWGDGGEHGEEWSSMHNRFRQGIRQMVDWYKSQDVDFDPQSDDSARSRAPDEDEEVVLVLLTHGAGCNALIGALTNQPVLMDVGMASLTMAVHKNRFDTVFPSLRRPSIQQDYPTSRRRRSSVDIGLSQEYDMKLIASSEHLRAGADPLRIPQLQMNSLATISEGGRKGNRISPPSSGVATPSDISRPKNSSLGSIRRSTVTSRTSRSYTGMSGVSQRSASPAPGAKGASLWTDRKSSVAVSEEEAPQLLSSAVLSDVNSASGEETKENVVEPLKRPSGTWQPKASSGLSRAGTLHSPGLWGSSRPSSSASRPTSSASRNRASTVSQKL